MHIKKNIRLLFWLGLGLGVLAGCSPANTALEPGCSEGGTGVYSPEDVQCHLARLDPGQVQHLDPDTALLLAAPGEADNWAGAAILYHFPSKSMLAFDEAGDPDPQTSRFSSRAGLAALSELAGDAGGMAAIKQQVQRAPLLVRIGTAAGDLGLPPSTAESNSALVQAFQAANETPISLRFLFTDNPLYSLMADESITRHYLGGDSQSGCDRFRSDYPDLGGVVTLSRIGFSPEGTGALVAALLECGPQDRQAFTFTLARSSDGWHVTPSLRGDAGSAD